jgi:hypothetical protein
MLLPKQNTRCQSTLIGNAGRPFPGPSAMGACPPEPGAVGSGPEGRVSPYEVALAVEVPGRSLPQYGWSPAILKPVAVAWTTHEHSSAGSWPKIVE